MALRKQLAVVTRQIEELQMIKSRIRHRCAQMEYSVAVKDKGEEVTVERVERQFILLEEVRPPHTLEDVSLATKQCFVRAFREHLPIYFQSGAIVPYERIVQGAYTQAEYAFLPIGKSASGRRFGQGASFRPLRMHAPHRGLCLHRQGLRADSCLLREESHPDHVGFLRVCAQ